MRHFGVLIIMKDLTNYIFNEWTVIRRVENDKYKNPQWLCKCSCGTERVLLGASLRCNRAISCGCKRFKNLEGQTFGYLTATKCLGTNNTKGKGKHLCKCVCGNEIIVTTDHLIQNNTTSCGCLINSTEFKNARKIRSKLNWQDIQYRNKVCKNIKLKQKYGKDHHCFNPNISDEEREISRRRYPSYQTWCSEVYKKYNYTCQKCRAYNAIMNESGGITAHHILSYKDYKDQRLDVENGICLCKNCHILFHRKYGYKNFTPDNLKEFLV